MSSDLTHKDPYANAKEITFRGIILGLIITVIFTSSNLYLALKVGLSVASSIPAAILSMALFRGFKDSNILENNIVQTIASSAGTLVAVIFALPALVITGYWSGFDFWYTAGICGIGGVLGVMYSIPLRRAMVVESDLKFPEGVAAAEVLKVGSKLTQEEKAQDKSLPKGEVNLEHTKTGAFELTMGALVGGVYTICQSGFKFFADEIMAFTQIGTRIYGFGTGMSMALLGAGYLAGINIAISFIIGTIVTWLIAIPLMTYVDPSIAGADIGAIAMGVWKKDVRFIGVGVIAVGSLWSLLVLMKPVIKGIHSSLKQMRMVRQGHRGQIVRTDFDMPFHYVIGFSLLLFFPLIYMFRSTLLSTPLDISSGAFWQVVLLCTLFAFIFGFLVSSVAGFMAGIAGSSSSPISGISVLTVLTFGTLLYFFIGPDVVNAEGTQNAKAAGGLIIFVTSVILSIGAIANDNLQDLKTGYLVKATPFKQQIALIIGVVMGAMVIPPILNLLHQAYGFTGSLPREGMDPALALSAPQANLIAQVVEGIFHGDLNWNMISIGVALAVGFIVIETILKKIKAPFYINTIAVGMAIYLPMAVNVTLAIGGVLSWIIDRKIKSQLKSSTASEEEKEKKYKVAEKISVLIASGFIVGESMMGILIAIIITMTGNQDPLNIMPASLAPLAQPVGISVFMLILVFFYRHVTAKK